MCNYYGDIAPPPQVNQEEYHKLIMSNLPKDKEKVNSIMHLIKTENVIITDVSFSGRGWFNEHGNFCTHSNVENKYKYKIGYWIISSRTKYGGNFLYNKD